MSAISVNGLTVSFGNLTVLGNLEIKVDQGEFLVLLGPSGCGKSTLLNAIAGLIEPAGGTIEIGGRDVTDFEPKDRGIAMVFQSYALYPKMTVRGNLAFGLKVARLARDEIERRVQKAAEFLQISDLLDRRPVQLSGGQRQRVAIGRALVRNADVFLFDEPLSNLDAKLRAELRVEIKRLHRDLGSTMIYVTHDQIEALTLADRIAVMKDGIIQQLGTPHEIYDSPANFFVASFIGSPSMNFIEGRIAMADGAPRFPERRFRRAVVLICFPGHSVGYAVRRSGSASGKHLGRWRARRRNVRHRGQGRSGRTDGCRHGDLEPGRRPLRLGAGGFGSHLRRGTDARHLVRSRPCFPV